MLPVPVTFVWLPDSVTPDLDRALHYTALWGLDGVELRVVDGPTRRVPHVNEKRLRQRLDASEMDVATVLPDLFAAPPTDRAAALNDLAALPETIAFARRIGAPCVAVPAFGATGDALDGDALAAAADTVRRAAEACTRGGVTLLVEHGPDTACPTAADLARLLDAAGAGRAVWSPAEAFVAGEMPEAGLAALGGRIGLVRVRDGTAWGGALADTEVGAGALGWSDLLRRLVASGFDGPLSLDVRAEPKAKTGLRSATALHAAVRDAVREARR